MLNHGGRAISLEGIEKLDVPLSSAVVVGGLIFVSGQVAYDPHTGEIKRGTFEEEARLAFSNLQKVLEAAGSGLPYVIKINAYLSDLEKHFAVYNRIYRELFKPPYPARTTVGADLGGLQIEIEAIARTADSNCKSARSG